MNAMDDTPGFVDILRRVDERMERRKNIDICLIFRQCFRLERGGKKPKKDQKNFQKGLA